MNAKSYSSLPWPLLLSAKFVQVNLIGTVLAAVLALLGQIAVIGAFILPLKIVMLIGGDGIPEFLPVFMESLDKEVVVSALAGLSVASYIFYQLSAKAIEVISLSGVAQIEKRTQKLYLFEGQRELTQRSYTKYIDAVASFSYILLGTALLAIIYPEIAVTFVSYVTLCVTGSLLIFFKNNEIHEENITYIQKHIPTLVGVGFFLIFLWILVDYIFLTMPSNFLVLLVSIVLGRQLLSQTAVAINSLVFLSNHKIKLKAILLHGEVLQPSAKKSDSFWEFLEPGSAPNKQLQVALMDLSGAFKDSLNLEWRDSALPGIAFLNATADRDGKVYLVKVFARNKLAEALHEAALLLERPESLPSPKLLATHVILGHHLHIFDLTGYSSFSKIPKPSEHNSLVLSVSNSKVGDALVSRYTRSHQMLWDRLDESLVKKIVLTSPGRDIAKEFLSKLPSIKETLRCQPLCLYNPQVGNPLLWATKSESVVLLHWGKWSLEPYGAGLSLNYGRKESGLDVLSEASDSSLKSTGERKNVILSATIYKVSQQLMTHQFNKAITTIEKGDILTNS